MQLTFRQAVPSYELITSVPYVSQKRKSLRKILNPWKYVIGVKIINVARLHICFCDLEWQILKTNLKLLFFLWKLKRKIGVVIM
jgi:hypothetical protein